MSRVAQHYTVRVIHNTTEITHITAPYDASDVAAALSPKFCGIGLSAAEELARLQHQIDGQKLLHAAMAREIARLTQAGQPPDSIQASAGPSARLTQAGQPRDSAGLSVAAGSSARLTQAGQPTDSAGVSVAAGPSPSPNVHLHYPLRGVSMYNVVQDKVDLPTLVLSNSVVGIREEKYEKYPSSCPRWCIHCSTPSLRWLVVLLHVAHVSPMGRACIIVCACIPL